MEPSRDDWISLLERRSTTGAPAASEVVLVGYPVRLGLRYRAHMAEVLREMQMIAAATPEGAGGGGQDDGGARPEAGPARLAQLAVDVARRYGKHLAGPSEQAELAAAQGVPRIDLPYPLLPESREVILHFARVMEDVDRYCEEEALITLCRPPDLYALRRWIVEEFVRQYDGEPPRPWPGEGDGGAVDAGADGAGPAVDPRPASDPPPAPGPRS
ncbi:MAG: hypothetical protein ACRDYU_17330 [Actinomycetes bacterium]